MLILIFGFTARQLYRQFKYDKQSKVAKRIWLREYLVIIPVTFTQNVADNMVTIAQREFDK